MAGKSKGRMKKTKAKKAKSGGSPYHAQLEAAVMALTGKTNRSEVLGVLAGMPKLKETNDRLARVEHSNRLTRVKSMLAKAKEEGRVRPGEHYKSLKAMGLKDVKWLRAHLETLPAMVTTDEDEGFTPNLSPEQMSFLNRTGGIVPNMDPQNEQQKKIAAQLGMGNTPAFRTEAEKLQYDVAIQAMLKSRAETALLPPSMRGSAPQANGGSRTKF